jgi:hypothetical protein
LKSSICPNPLPAAGGPPVFRRGRGRLFHFTPAQLELLETILFNGASVMAEEFMLIHDIALYHSDYTIDSKEKTALFQLKQVSEIIERISEEI